VEAVKVKPSVYVCWLASEKVSGPYNFASKLLVSRKQPAYITGLPGKWPVKLLKLLLMRQME